MPEHFFNLVIVFENCYIFKTKMYIFWECKKADSFWRTN